MNKKFSIVGLGEALFDVLDGGRQLGGAPLNVAFHANQLAEVCEHGGRGIVVSRIGQDDLGRQLISELKKKAMETAYLQIDPVHPTGRVLVDVDSAGQPVYDIEQNAAWDAIAYGDDLQKLAQQCGAVCFGSLAQRSATSRESINQFLAGCKGAIKMFDVNLRNSQGAPCYNASILDASCKRATVLKLNEHELPVVGKLLEIGEQEHAMDNQIFSLIQKYQLKMVVLTRGAKGTQIFMADGTVYQGKPVSYPPAKNNDSVGAGDGCSAAILTGSMLGFSPQHILSLANHVGAFVASQPGGTPKLPACILEMVKPR